jgi:hypothetical protein
VRVLRAFRDAVVAAVLAAFRGWIALLWRPWESTRLIGVLPLHLWHAWGLLRDLFGGGLTVTTPREGDPTLRTTIVGAGDLTTRVMKAPSLTPALVTEHFRAVRERLEPLAAIQEAFSLLSALVAIAITAYFSDVFRAERWLDAMFELVGSSFVVSFVWALVVRLAVQLSFRAVRRFLLEA